MSYTNSAASKAAKQLNMAKANTANRIRNRAIAEARRLHPGAYKSWAAMKTRCNNPNHNRYVIYGGRGISYDPRWESFINFSQDMGERPTGLTLDRIDVEGDYCLSNCRWADYSTQNANKRVGNHLPRVF